MSDPKAEKYVDEVTFHGYSGQLSGMTKMHFEFPMHGFYFFEGSLIGINGAVQILDLLKKFWHQVTIQCMGHYFGFKSECQIMALLILNSQ